MKSPLFLLKALAELVWPRTCHVCGATLTDAERYVCTTCRNLLPYVPQQSFGDGPSPRPVGETEMRVASCRAMVHATSWIYYAPSAPDSHLLSDIKYHGCSRLARHLGEAMGRDLLPTGFFNGVDCIVPVPLHRLRELKRGYNQSRMLAQGLSRVSGQPVRDMLMARFHRSQTRLSDRRRALNVQGVFRTRRDALSGYAPDGTGCHILLVDDVCTTGATLLSAADTLLRTYPRLSISFLTLALTTRR